MSERPIGADATGSVEPEVAVAASPATRRVVGRPSDHPEWTDVASRLLVTSVWTAGLAIVVISGLLLWGLLFEPTSTADPFLGQRVTLGSAEETTALDLSEGRSNGAPTTTKSLASPGIIVADSAPPDSVPGPTGSPSPESPADPAPASPVRATPAAEPLLPTSLPAQQPLETKPEASTSTTAPPTTQPSDWSDSDSRHSGSDNSGSGSGNSGSGSDNSGSGSSNSGSGSSGSGSGKSGSGDSDDPDSDDPDSDSPDSDDD